MNANSIDSNIVNKLSQAQQVIVLVSGRAQVNELAGALGLYLALSRGEQAKDVTIASNLELRAEFSRLIGLDEISESINNRDLVIRIPDFASVENVSHNNGANDTLELYISPKKGKKIVDTDKIEFDHRGAQADIVITVGVNTLAELGQLYSDQQAFFDKTDILALNLRTDPNFTNLLVTDANSLSYAELVDGLLTRLQVSYDEEAATNLLSSLDAATNLFQHPAVTSQAFSLAAKLIQAGAKREMLNQQQVNQQAKAQGQGALPFIRTNQTKSQKPPQAPADWLRPKIMKTSKNPTS